MHAYRAADALKGAICRAFSDRAMLRAKSGAFFFAAAAEHCRRPLPISAQHAHKAAREDDSLRAISAEARQVHPADLAVGGHLCPVILMLEGDESGTEGSDSLVAIALSEDRQICESANGGGDFAWDDERREFVAT